MGSVGNIRLGQCLLIYNDVELGHTKGGVEVTIKNEITEVTVDKYGSTPAKAYHKGTRVEVKTTLSEYEFTQMEQVINAATKATTQLNIGKAAGYELEGAVLTLHPVSQATEDTSLDVTIWKAVIMGDSKIPFKEDGETVYEVTWLALVSPDDADENGKGFLMKIGTESEA